MRHGWLLGILLAVWAGGAVAAPPDAETGIAPLAMLQSGIRPEGWPTILALGRQTSAPRDKPLVTSTYAIGDAGPPAGNLFRWNTDITNTVANARDAAGNFVDGPAAISLALQASVVSSAALNAAFAGHPDRGSQHVAMWATALRKPDSAPPGRTAFTPTPTRPYAQLWAQIWNLIDATNLPSSLGGALLNEDDIQVNNLDDANNRLALSIDLRNQLAPSATVRPAEVHAGIGIYSFGDDRPSSGTFKSFITMGGNYSIAGIDLRRIRPMGTTVATALAAPSTVLAVANVLPFTSTGDAYKPPAPGNPMAVLVNGHRYTCVGFALGNTGMAAGTITLSTPVSPADGVLNAKVANATLHALWLGNGASIAFSDGGGVETFYDPAAHALRFRGADMLFDNPVLVAAPGTGLVVAQSAVVGGRLAVRGGVEVAAGGAYRVGADQVVGARIDGWGTSSGGTRGGLDGQTATPRQTAQALAALLADLKTHGLIGQ